MSAILGSRVGRTSNGETVLGITRLLEQLHRDKLALTAALDRALDDLAANRSARTVAVELADALDRFTAVSRTERRRAA